MAQQEKSHDGLAVLSMHQPWASLLVHGIKRMEGRTWPTSHRGRLWIHATSVKPSEEDIQELEHFYAAVHGEEGHLPSFPASYPQGALLGAVEVVDCVENEAVCTWEKLAQSVKQEALSPFCWLCERPQRLVVPQKMSGQRRIWRLPNKQMAAGLQRALKDPATLPPFTWPRPLPSEAPTDVDTKAPGLRVRARLAGSSVQ